MIIHSNKVSVISIVRLSESSDAVTSVTLLPSSVWHFENSNDVIPCVIESEMYSFLFYMTIQRKLSPSLSGTADFQLDLWQVPPPSHSIQSRQALSET